MGRGWAVVFTPTPNVVETRLFNALAVGENMSRFAFDVNVAFLNAESTEEERIPVRMEPRHVPGKENPADLLTKIVDVPTQQHLGPWLSGKKMLNEPGPALKDMRPKEKTGKANCACTACGEVQQMWWQRTWMV